MATRTRIAGNGSEAAAKAAAADESCPIFDDLAAAFRHVSVGMAIGTVEGRLIDVNPAFCRMLGYTRDELLALGFDGINHPDDRGVDPVRWSSLAAGDRDSYQREKRYLRQDGSLLWVLITVSALRDDDGQFVGGLAQIQDISAQKAAEAALRDNETRLASLVGQLPIALYTLDLDDGGVFGFVSPQFAGLTGFKPGSHAGTFEERIALVHPDDRDFVRAANDRCGRTGESMEIEYRLRGVDGDWIWVYNQALLTRDEHGTPMAWHGLVLDVSARKRLEASLRESEERFRRAFADAGIGMSLCTPDLVIIDANDAYCRLVGVPREGVIGRSTGAFTHPADLETGAEQHARLIAGEIGAYAIEKRYLRPDGSIVTGLLTVSSIRDETGALLYSIGQTQDITAQKAAEAALRENVARLRTILEQVPAAVYSIADDAGAYSYVSPRFSGLTGLPLDMSGHGYEAYCALIHPEDVAATRALDREATATRQPLDAQYRLRTPDGSWAWVHDRARVVENPDGALVWHGVLLDISEQKRLEATVREQEAHLRTLVEKLPAALYSIDTSEVGRYIFATPRFSTLTGFAIDSQSVDMESFYARMHPDDIPAVRAADTEAARGGQAFDAQYRMLGEDGQWRWLHDRSSLERDELGTPVAWHGIMVDISPQKRVEDALRENEAHLQSPGRSPLCGLL